MMKKALPLLLISMILLPLYGAADRDPRVEFDHLQQTDPGKQMTIEVTLTNTTSQLLWGLKGVISPNEIPSDIRNYIKIIEGEKAFTDRTNIRVGETESITLKIEIDNNAEVGTYKIPLLIRGEIGNCRGGCVPYLLVKNIEFNVVKDYPSIKVDFSSYPEEVFQGESISIPFKISNFGQGNANNITLRVPSTNNFTTSLSVGEIRIFRPQNSRDVILTITADEDAEVRSYNTDLIIEYFDAYENKRASLEPISFTIKDSELIRNAEAYYVQGNEYFNNGNYSLALEQYEKSKEAYEQLGFTEKVSEINAKIELTESEIELKKADVSVPIYVGLGVLISFVSMAFGILVGTLTQKPKY